MKPSEVFNTLNKIATRVVSKTAGRGAFTPENQIAFDVDDMIKVLIEKEWLDSKHKNDAATEATQAVIKALRKFIPSLPETD